MSFHYAHSLENEPPEKWEPLEKHLYEVSRLAGDFASKFGAREWGEISGLWYDLGKYSERFQEYLRRENGLEAHLEEKPGTRVDHSFFLFPTMNSCQSCEQKMNHVFYF